MKRYILLDNAYEAWAMAVKSCNDMLDGKLTLQCKKSFVESLHNAIELFIKQLLLNKDDYRVVDRIKKIDKDGQPAKSFYESKDLNSFFGSLKPEERQQFNSIKFSDIVKNAKSILDEYLSETEINYSCFIDCLDRLNRIRNDGTHFYINSADYLDSDTFKDLHNLMVRFYDILKYYHLLPYFGKPPSYNKKLRRLYFEESVLEICDYYSLVKDSSSVKKIAPLMDGCQYWGSPTDAAYAIADCICNTVDALKNYDFDDLYVYVEVLFDMGLLTIEGGYIEDVDEKGELYPIGDFYVRVNI